MPAPASESVVVERRVYWPATVLGALFLLAFFQLAAAVEFRGSLGGPFLYVGWREGLFWVAHLSLAIPGFLLLGHGLGARLGPLLERAVDALLHDSRRLKAAGAILVLLLFCLAVVGRATLLRDTPITDDENANLFGARMIAAGHLMVPRLEPREALPLLFVYDRDGMLASFDYPGGLFLGALGLVTGIGSLLWAALAALSGGAVAVAGWRLWGAAGAVVAGLFWTVSPMVASLSFTTHAQLLSRSFVAFALACYVILATEPSPRRPAVAGLLLGISCGLAFLCRPIESASLLLPPAAHLLVRLARAPALRRAAVPAVLAFAVAVLFFAWYNTRITGTWWLQARFDLPPSPVSTPAGSVLSRMGTNLGFNVVLIFVYFLGPLGVLLVVAGLAGGGNGAGGARRAVALPLGLGLGLSLLVSLLHDDAGIHLVGPIHYSEAAATLVLLSVLGLRRLWGRLSGVGLAPGRGTALLAAYLGAMVLFLAVHAATLRDQATITRIPLDAVAKAGLRNAVVVADPLHRLFDVRDDLGEIGSWVIQYPHPDPFLRDEVLFVYPKVDPRRLAALYPDRDFYRLTYKGTDDPVLLERLVPVDRAPTSAENPDKE